MFFIPVWPEEKVTRKQRRTYNLIGRSLAFALTLGYSFVVYGLENRVRRGANLIICTHGDEEKDVAAIARAHSHRGDEKNPLGQRQIFFAANTELYYPSELRRLAEKSVIKRWGEGGMDYKILGLLSRKKLIEPFIKIVTSNIANIGCIPINIRGGDNSVGMRMIKQYLMSQRVVALIQYYSKARHELNTPLFRIKPCWLAVLIDLYENQGLDPAITLMSVKKYDKKLIANIGGPAFISDFYVQGQLRRTIHNAKDCLEARLEQLYHQH